LPVFVEKSIRVLHQESQADRAHLALELKLHVEDDRVAAKPDVVRWIGFVSKGQLEAKLLRIEADCPLDVARAENRVRFIEHRRLPNKWSHERPKREGKAPMALAFRSSALAISGASSLPHAGRS
jgi:hypothetical protein